MPTSGGLTSRCSPPPRHDPGDHEIAERVAAALDGVEFDGPEVRLLIVRAAFASPHVRTERHAEEVVAGFEGRPSERCKGAR